MSLRRHPLGVLSVHLDAAPCEKGCSFCYLGARLAPNPGELVRLRSGAPDPLGELERAVERQDYEELAIAVSEPVDAEAVSRLCTAARRRGRPVAITTTVEIACARPDLLRLVDRLNLSVDPWKIPDDILARTASAASRARAAARALEVIAIVTLSTPGFAELLVGGLLEALVDLPDLRAVALNALKPPPPFCDRAFWLTTFSRLGPLLDRALDRRLFLDCYVAARLLGTGGCPGRPDLTIVGDRLAFRSCVYAAPADRALRTAEELDEVARGYVAPTSCPFQTRLDPG